MAYYTALITAWNGATQPPTGVTGTGLSSGDTTAQKLAKVNAWTVIGAAQPANIPVSTVIATILSSDLLALTALQLQQLQFTLQSANTIFAPPSGSVRATFASVFAGKSSLTALNTLVATYDTPAVNWCLANGYPSNGTVGELALVDAQAAGVT